MILGNLATYPARAATLRFVVETIAPQLDQLNLVLNGYHEIPAYLARFSNVQPIIPPEDTKDTGKLFPETGGASHVFLVDDDILFPEDYVALTLERISYCAHPRAIYSYHGLVYTRPSLRRLSKNTIKQYFSYSPSRVFLSRKTYWYEKDLAAPVIVDELGSGVAILPADLVPPFDYVRTAPRFLDVRLARWCFEHEITPICLPRAKGWLKTISHGESIYEDFSRACPAHVADEILRYAFKVKGRDTFVGAPHTEGNTAVRQAGMPQRKHP